MVAFNGLPSKFSSGKNSNKQRGEIYAWQSNNTPFFFGKCFLSRFREIGSCQDPGDPGTKLATGCCRSLCSTDGAIAALLMDGRVQVWGDAMNGGNLEEVPGSAW